jgi:hypothetical protein
MKKLICLLNITILILQSCSSGDSSSGADNSTPSGGLLLKQMVTKNGETYTYEYNGNKITKINYDNNGYSIYTYTGDLITQIKGFSADGVLTGSGEYFYSNNNLVRIKYTKNGILKSQDDFVYNSDGSVTSSYSNIVSGIQKIDYSEKIYFINGNCVKLESGGKTAVYNYDNKNSPFKNITGYLKLIRFGDNFLTINNPSSIIKPIFSTTTNTINLTYQYNSEGYPISGTSIQDGSDAVAITYYSYY